MTKTPSELKLLQHNDTTHFFLPLLCILRKEWLQLKDEYLTLQKRSMTSLKKCINKIDHQEHKSLKEKDDDANSEFCFAGFVLLPLLS